MRLPIPASISVWSVYVNHQWRRTLHKAATRKGEVMVDRTYSRAIACLNSTQSGFQVLADRRRAGTKLNESAVQQMRQFLELIGHKSSALDELNIVHVAGTKGKGTTCAFVNSILTQCQQSIGIPKRIGLYTSPHLVSVRERIRINSAPISKEMFAKYFFEVWDAFEKPGIDGKKLTRPPYFRFLTLVSFHTFLREAIDVAVYEVGVGGELDSTNVIDHPAVTGITTLGIDHAQTLGETVDKIAWHKAGIFKTGTPAFSVRQVPEAIPVLESRAKERSVELTWVDAIPAVRNVRLNPDEDFQIKNASLAVALSIELLRKLGLALVSRELKTNNDTEVRSSVSNAKTLASMEGPSKELSELIMHGSPLSEVDKLPQEFITGLEGAVWRARCEIKVVGEETFFVDGAHTADSLEVAANWFGKHAKQRPGPRILIFNQQSTRDATSLLYVLHTALKEKWHLNFEHVIFCANVTFNSHKYKADFVNRNVDPESLTSLSHQKKLRVKWRSLDKLAEVSVLPTIEDARDAVADISSQFGKVNVLVTGSFHLVGGFLSIVEGEEYALSSTTRTEMASE